MKTRTRAYIAWLNMRQRCRNPKRSDAVNYMARGITIVPEWDSFATFLADMGEPPEGMSLDRVDNDGPYSPKNCQWRSRTAQNNNRRCNVRIEYQGHSQTLAVWSRALGIGRVTLLKRLQRGVPIALAFETKGYLAINRPAAGTALLQLS
jgi:hypothetical protein